MTCLKHVLGALGSEAQNPNSHDMEIASPTFILPPPLNHINMNRSNVASIEKAVLLPTFLGLPFELRSQILKHAFLGICSPHPTLGSKIPMGITLLFPHQLPPALRKRSDAAIYGYWGLEPMTRILRLNRQLYSEAIDVLYGGDFVFEFSNATVPGDVKLFLDLMGEKKRIIKHIGVRMIVNLKIASLPRRRGDDGKEKRTEMDVKRDTWEVLRSELESLRSVRIELGFVEVVRGLEVGKERAIREILRMAAPFSWLGTFVPDGHWTNEERISILDACKQRIIARKESAT